MAVRKCSLVLAIMVVIVAGSGEVQAQKQTAAGAQKFLASVGFQGSASVTVSDDVPVILMREGEANMEETYRFVRDASTVGAGSDLCHTTVRSAPLDPATMSEVWRSGNRWQQVARNPPVVLHADIDWSRATIKRGGYFYGPDSSVPWFTELQTTVTAQIGSATLSYRSNDPDMVERIEFAMKFLQASCDRTADTGF